MPEQVVFVANFHITETLFAVAERLQRCSVEVHWVTFSDRWREWLTRRGVPPSHVVRLGRATTGPARIGSAPTGLDRLSELSPEAHEPSIFQAIESDRILRLRPVADVVDVLSRIRSDFAALLRDRHVTAVFGEATWAAEVVLSYVARHLGVPYLSPQMVRYPLYRFGFFHAPSQSRLMTLRATEPGDEAIAEVTMRHLLAPTDGSPGLWASNRVSMDRFVRKPGLLMEKLWLGLTDARQNPTQMTPVEYARAKNPFTLRRGTQSARRVMEGALTRPEDVGAPFVLMPLQVQPEASIDVLASWARNQIENVRLVAAQVPAGVTVAVKEHSHQFGSRPMGYYEEMARIPGVVLVDAMRDSRSWSDESLAVVTPSGSMAYEKALRGGRAILFTRMFFDSLPGVAVVTSDDQSALRLQPLEGTFESRIEASHRFLAEVAACSVEGFVSNPRSNPEVLATENLGRLRDAFLMALEQL